jgi:glyceraldehyde-3-phosphate dehydrogenase/erythrose-4-phosphate dehydrogenase
MITIVGAGALGSHVALLLRNSKNHLRVIDFDKVEQKNTQAQFHSKMGLRKNKAQALSQALQGMFGTKIHPVPHKLTADNWSELLKDSFMVIDCTDNIAARKLTQEYYDEYAVPVLHGCLSADGTFARVVWDEIFEPDAEGEEGEATCEDGEALPFFMFTASVIAMTVQEFITGSHQKRSYQLTPQGVTRI